MATSADIILIIVIIVVSFLLLAGIVLLLIIYSHPDDANQAWIPKGVTVFGLFLAFAALLAMPYDVAASNTNTTIIDTAVLWEIIFITMALLIAVGVPFTFFYYESDEGDDAVHESFFDTQWGQAIKMTGFLFAALIVAFFIMYTLLNTATIPMTRMIQSGLNSSVVIPLSQGIDTLPNFPLNTPCPFGACSSTPFTWQIPVSFVIYVIAFVSFIGWWFFCIFCGVGFVALPWDLINEFQKRPTPISTSDYVSQKDELGHRCVALIELANRMLREHEKGGKGFFARRGEANELTQFEKNYFYLKKDYQLLTIAYKLKGGNPLYYILKLVLGLIGSCISALWIIHIIVYMLPAKPVSPFLNTFFVDLSNGISGFPLFGVIAFALFSFYLLLAVIAGNFRFGVRFIFWKIYPMEVGNTLMNAFLFNTWFILLTAIPATQFCVYAFPIYTNNTTVELIFGTQVKYLQFFHQFYARNVFVIFLICVFGLSMAFIPICARDEAAEVEKKLDRIARSSSTTVNMKDLALDVDLKV